jgi:hypothetical protein
MPEFLSSYQTDSTEMVFARRSGARSRAET